MKQLEVQIMGQSYLLGCPENGEVRLLEAVSKVDAAMCKIRDAGKIKARDRIAVLAALNLAFEVSERIISAPASAPTPALQAAFDAPDVQDTAKKQLAVLLRRMDEVLSLDARLL